MQQVTLISVNVGQPGVIGSYRGRPVISAIGKQPVTVASLHLDSLNLEGDRQADLHVHGGADKAVYAYPSEHIREWALELGQDLGPASFGENLTTAGVLEGNVCIGDVWAWGEALLQVSQPRQPCYKLATYRARNDLPKKLVAAGRTGWYFRVLRPGQVPVRGPIEIVERDPAGISVLAVHQARILGLGAPEDWRIMAALPALTASWREDMARRLASVSSSAAFAVRVGPGEG
ncbi:MAG TPA: MOSC domain-containing protein [Chloroflexota bacterium]|nr:MOSC domain-containing protein [Chloroflexota bacterium]